MSSCTISHQSSSQFMVQKEMHTNRNAQGPCKIYIMIQYDYIQIYVFMYILFTKYIVSFGVSVYNLGLPLHSGGDTLLQLSGK